jgi:hypothetical protein
MRVESINGDYVLHPPLPFLPSIVQEGSRWHIPRNDGRWLCVDTTEGGAPPPPH